MNSICRGEFTRINYVNEGDLGGFYEYKTVTGPDVGLCLKDDPGINDFYGNPVVDYKCNDSGGTTQEEEEWSDPPNPADLQELITLSCGGDKLWTDDVPDCTFTLVSQ
jgi:hypothetical protein